MRPNATAVARSVVSVLVYLYVAKTAEPIVGRFGEQMIRTILCIFNRDRWSNRRTVDCWEKVKKDAGQSPTLAHPATPLAIGVTKICFVDKTSKNWSPRQSSLRTEK